MFTIGLTIPLKTFLDACLRFLGRLSIASEKIKIIKHWFFEIDDGFFVDKANKLVLWH